MIGLYVFRQSLEEYDQLSKPETKYRILILQKLKKRNFQFQCIKLEDRNFSFMEISINIIKPPGKVFRRLLS